MDRATFFKKELEDLKLNEPLKKWTTFRIGGPAKYFFIAKSKEDLIKAIEISQKLKIPYFILGEGSNLLVSDKGFKGLIIKIQDSRFKIQDSKIIASAGVKLSELVKISMKNGLTGLEWAAGVPGTLGGAIYGNAGWPSNRKNISAVVEKVEVLEIKDLRLKVKNFSKRDCQFGYRESIFKHANSPTLGLRPRGMRTGPCEYPNLIILSARLKLKKGNKEKIKKNILGILRSRKNKIPPGFSAGCIFKNVKYKIPRPFRTRLAQRNWAAQLQNFKKSGIIPTGWLIEQSGLKGKKIGGAKISDKHANFILNEEKAKARDVFKLINLIKKRVKNKFGLELKEEIELLGF